MKPALTMSLAMFLTSGLFGYSTSDAASCSDWPAQFDRIKNPQVLQDLRSKRNNWSALIEQSGGPDAVIITAKSTILDAQSRLQTANDIARQLAATPADATSSVTWGQCSGPGNALMAAKCEALNMQEVILSMQGMIEIAECRR